MSRDLGDIGDIIIDFRTEHLEYRETIEAIQNLIIDQIKLKTTIKSSDYEQAIQDCINIIRDLDY